MSAIIRHYDDQQEIVHWARDPIFVLLYFGNFLSPDI